MHCPFCNHDDTKVTDSRLAGEGHQIRRRRECLSCGERFTTFETAELVMPQVVKNDNTRQPFDDGKLRAGIMKALEKRPVSREAIGLDPWKSYSSHPSSCSSLSARWTASIGSILRV